jgi:hypothetical protein
LARGVKQNGMKQTGVKWGLGVSRMLDPNAWPTFTRCTTDQPMR